MPAAYLALSACRLMRGAEFRCVPSCRPSQLPYDACVHCAIPARGGVQGGRGLTAVQSLKCMVPTTCTRRCPQGGPDSDAVWPRLPCVHCPFRGLSACPHHFVCPRPDLRHPLTTGIPPTTSGWTGSGPGVEPPAPDCPEPAKSTPSPSWPGFSGVPVIAPFPSPNSPPTHPLD